MSEALEAEISAFFNKYLETFATWDGDQIAKLYCAPALPASPCGVTVDALFSVT